MGCGDACTVLVHRGPLSCSIWYLVNPWSYLISVILPNETIKHSRAFCQYPVIISKRSMHMTRRVKDEEREERINMEIVVDANGPEEQAIEDWQYWVDRGYEM
jgi:hypothetical protein